MVLKNLLVSVRNFYKSPVTRIYPEHDTEMSDRFKGLQKLDKEACIGCGICANTCPNEAIRVVRARINKDSKKQRWFPEIDIGHCMFCGLCIDQCPKEALSCTKVCAKGIVTWQHEDLLCTPDILAREVVIVEDEEGEQ
ncbi:NADH-quinone oxidoreductase subunit I [Methanosalsum natronophilum]|uniref:NADH-quinone oxidoreductase subunit I n=1 Tax=Methanosalsum natronophilum TaxID=768733 RepID=A0A3R7VV47_9EURY|nr:MAG: NADH-quinone oxidoreductase subunit I [Methanosalsum natronophilum]